MAQASSLPPPSLPSDRRTTPGSLGQRGTLLAGPQLLRLLADQLRQRRDLTQSPHTVQEIRPEVHTQPPARLLQTRKRVPRPTSRFAPRAAADLPLLDVVPHMAFAVIGVRGDLGPLQHPEQIGPVLPQFLEHPIDTGKTPPLPPQRVEPRFQDRLVRRLWLLTIPLEISVELPNLVPHALQGRPVLAAVADHPRQGPFGVNPAAGMAQDVELLRTVAEDR